MVKMEQIKSISPNPCVCVLYMHTSISTFFLLFLCRGDDFLSTFNLKHTLSTAFVRIHFQRTHTAHSTSPNVLVALCEIKRPRVDGDQRQRGVMWMWFLNLTIPFRKSYCGGVPLARSKRALYLRAGPTANPTQKATSPNAYTLPYTAECRMSTK